MTKKTKTFTSILKTPVGNLGIQTQNDVLTHLEYLYTEHTPYSDNTSFTQKIHQEIESYFQNPNHTFNIPLQITGTPFQTRVWEILRTIPVGKTFTYSDIAKKLNTSPRAIGNACRTNHIPLIIPCHRIVAKDHIGGFTGQTQGPFLEIKKWLLQHESL